MPFHSCYTCISTLHAHACRVHVYLTLRDGVLLHPAATREIVEVSTRIHRRVNTGQNLASQTYAAGRGAGIRGSERDGRDCVADDALLSGDLLALDPDPDSQGNDDRNAQHQQQDQHHHCEPVAHLLKRPLDSHPAQQRIRLPFSGNVVHLR